jgi:hypothetical protein
MLTTNSLRLSSLSSCIEDIDSGALLIQLRNKVRIQHSSMEMRNTCITC